MAGDVEKHQKHQKPIQLEGTTLEGGGQLIRLSIGLAAITHTPVEIVNIRGGRPKPGLKDQHLTAIKWLAQASGAKVEGATLGSKRVLFEPGEAVDWSGNIEYLQDGTAAKVVEIGMDSAGAVTLVLQAVLPFLLFAPSKAADDGSKQESTPILLRLRGGTNVSFSPSVDYVEQVLFPNFQLLGLPVMQLSPHHRLRRGYSSRGRAQPGEVNFLITPVKRGTTLKQLRVPVRRGAVASVDVTVLARSSTRRLISQRIKAAVKRCFPQAEVRFVVDEESDDNRPYLMLVAHTDSGFRLGRDWLYDKKMGRDPNVSQIVDNLIHETVDGLVDELSDDGGRARCLDSHMEDQVVVYMALASGRSQCERVIAEDARSTLHTQTARWVVDRVLGVSVDADGACDGIGLEAGCTRAEGESIVDTLARLELAKA